MSSSLSLPRRGGAVLSAVIIAFNLSHAPAFATSRSWIAGTGSAATAANWSPAATPGAGDDLLFQRTVNYTVTFNSSVPQANSHAYRSTNQVTLSITSPHTVSSFIEVGTFSGDNAAAIVDTGSLTCSGNITLGVNSGAIGTMNVLGSDADVHTVGSASDFIAGAAGTGNVTVSGGGLIQTGDDFIIGSSSTGNGTVTVTGGTGSLPNITLSEIQTTSSTGGDIFVGNIGDGALNLTSGGLANSAHDIKIAPSSSSTANVSLSGSFSILGSRLTADNNVDISRNDNITGAGTASVTVTSPAILNATNQLRIGDPNGGTGTLTINSGTVTCGTLVCNQAGAAVLNFNDGLLVVNGGTLTPPSTNFALNGAAAGDDPTLRLINGAAGTLNQIVVGNNRQASCEIQSGSTLNASGAGQIIGFASGSNGTLLVTGANSTFDATADSIEVGTSGTGALDIEAAGHAISQTGVIARNVGSTGTVTINGANSRWDIAGQLFVGGTGGGNGGTGQINVTTGGVLTFGSTSIIRTPGEITVTSGILNATGLLQLYGTLTLGGTGVMNGDIIVPSNGTIAGAGTVNGELTVSPFAIANLNGSGGTLNIGDDASTNAIHNSGTLNINGTVVLHDANTANCGDVVLNAGSVFSGNHGLTTTASDVISGTGTVNGDVFNNGGIQPTGANGITFNGILHNTTTSGISGTRIFFGGTGGYEGSGTCQADIAGAATSHITATGTLSLGANDATGFSYSGHLDAGGNIVTLIDSNGAVFNPGALTTINSGRIECPAGIGNSAGAAIQGDGLFVGTVTNSGFLDPHNLNPQFGGLITIQGNLFCNPSSTIDMEIGDTPASGNNDRINVSGTAAFDGTIQVRLKNGYIPHVGEQFIAVNATAGRTGTFVTIIPPSGPSAPCNNVTFVMVYSSTAAIVLIRPPLGCTALGDMDSNGSCGASDVPILVNAILHGPYNACADLNGDCVNDGQDIQIFVNCAI